MYKKYLADNEININLYMPTNQRQVREVIKLIKDVEK